MIRILLSGCNGRMGRVISELCLEKENCKIVAGIDIIDAKNYNYPVYKDINGCKEQADVIIDFSNAAAVPTLLTYAGEKSTPIVLATTGLDEKTTALLEKTAEKTAVFKSGNMSLGINLLCELIKKACAVFGDTFDVEIIEKHHNQKVDAPSGTAFMLADAAAAALPYEADIVFDRSKERKKRDKREIGISAVRGGTIVGEHEVIFAGHNEVITLAHSAQSREVFAAGALQAALFLAKQKAGIYSMTDLVESC